MHIRTDSFRIDANNQAQFFIVTAAGNCGFPIVASLGQLNQMYDDLRDIRERMIEHHAAIDVAQLFEEPKSRVLSDADTSTVQTELALSRDPVGSMLDRVQAEQPDLVSRERLCMEAVHGTSDVECDSNGGA